MRIKPQRIQTAFRSGNQERQITKNTKIAPKQLLGIENKMKDKLMPAKLEMRPDSTRPRPARWPPAHLGAFGPHASARARAGACGPGASGHAAEGNARESLRDMGDELAAGPPQGSDDKLIPQRGMHSLSPPAHRKRTYIQESDYIHTRQCTNRADGIESRLPGGDDGGSAIQEWSAHPVA